MSPNELETIEQALRHLLSSEAKRVDAPASASTHLSQAIVLLASLVPVFRPGSPETFEILTQAQEKLAALDATSKKPNEK